MKERIINKYNNSAYDEYCEIDEEIVDVMRKINSYDHIMAIHSCQGHDGSHGHQSYPYFAFLVDEIGWDIFWLKCAPKLAEGIKFKYTDYNIRVSINDFIEDNVDYCMISVSFINDSVDMYNKFWNRIEEVFTEFEK